MKKLEKIKFFILGVIVTLTICTTVVPTFAATIEAAFNSINIMINGQKVASVGESYKLDNGTEVPYSIVYKGTTYLPLRKVGELFGKEIGWDGNSSTASVSDKIKDDTKPVEPVEAMTKEKSISMYKDYPTVPDFGSYFNVKTSAKVDGAYCYNFSDCPDSPFAKYNDLLNKCGYAYIGDFNDDNNNSVIIYKKDNTYVMTGINKQYGFMITINNNYIQKDTTTQKIIMYRKHPNVPDFGAYFNIDIKAETEFGYAYSLGSYKIEKYYDLLKTNGFNYDSLHSFDTDDGIEVVAYKKGDVIVTVSQTKAFLSIIIYD